MADVSITPSGAGLSATGYTGWGIGSWSESVYGLGVGQPTVVIGYVSTPNSSNLSVVGYAAEINFAYYVAPTGQSVIIGSAPSITVGGLVITPSVGTITTTGYAPTAQFGLLGGWGFSTWGHGAWGTDDTYIQPVEGSVSIIGYAPTSVFGKIVTATGGISVIGSTPSVVVSSRVITPDAGAIVAIGQVPFLDLGISTLTSTLTVAGYAPVIDRSRNLTPLVGTVSLAGVAPILSFGSYVIPSTREVIIDGKAPAVSGSITPPKGTLTLVGGTAILSNANWNSINTSQTPGWVQIAA